MKKVVKKKLRVHSAPPLQASGNPVKVQNSDTVERKAAVSTSNLDGTLTKPKDNVITVNHSAFEITLMQLLLIMLASACGGMIGEFMYEFLYKILT